MILLQASLPAFSVFNSCLLCLHCLLLYYCSSLLAFTSLKSRTLGSAAISSVTAPHFYFYTICLPLYDILLPGQPFGSYFPKTAISTSLTSLPLCRNIFSGLHYCWVLIGNIQQPIGLAHESDREELCFAFNCQLERSGGGLWMGAGKKGFCYQA